MPSVFQFGRKFYDKFHLVNYITHQVFTGQLFCWFIFTVDFVVVNTSFLRCLLILTGDMEIQRGHPIKKTMELAH